MWLVTLEHPNMVHLLGGSMLISYSFYNDKIFFLVLHKRENNQLLVTHDLSDIPMVVVGDFLESFC